MIRPFKIKAQKDENGFYILPDSVFHKDEVISNLRYHEGRMKDVKNLMFAIICVVDQDRKRDTDVNGWTEKYVRINNVQLFYENFFLDEEKNMLYDLESVDELIVLQRHLKLNKILCGLR